MTGAEIRWPKLVRTPGEAVRFIDATGFCLLFPVKRVDLPSLYFAVTRRPDARWDSLTEMMWGWKDDLPQRRRVYYAKYFKARGTFLSLAMLPHFLASQETITAAGDAERLFASGRITPAARDVWKALEEHGPLATMELRHACGMVSRAGNARYKQAMLDLQCLLVVTHSGTEQESHAWPSARFDLTWRAFPKQMTAARKLQPAAARAAIAAKYREWQPDAPPQAVARLFGWSRAETAAALQFQA